ncbi:MAG: hypothetical protein RLZZ28_1624, partial [Bacteroidota bacterium]
MSKHVFTYLALGDSYTIGESVPLYENYPYQTVYLLRKEGILLHTPEIVAKTGWTSFELAEKMLHTPLLEQYDFISLLIGVNNQYRGLPLDSFQSDIDFLLRKAIHLSGNKKERVFVLSIPDWGQTSFAEKEKSAVIAAEINAFNEVCERLAKLQGVSFINITEETRKASQEKGLLANDQLHYSGRAYAIWAKKLAEKMK